MRRKRKNPNAPRKGAKIKVEPIRSLEDIQLIRHMLQEKPRDLALFTIGINTNLRASDLLRLRVYQVRDLKAGGSIEINEKKTGKPRRLTLNRACVQAIRNLLETESYHPGEHLFKSQKSGKALKVSSVHNLVKAWCKTIKLKGNYGSHTLRKTWGYHQRVTYRVDIPTLMVCFNHATQKQTLNYLCIQPEEITSVFKNEL
jgi:integrase